MNTNKAPRIQWRAGLARWVDAAPIKAQETLVVGTHLHQLDGYDPSTGEHLWSRDLGEYLDQPQQAGDSVLVRSSSGGSSMSSKDTNKLIAIDPLNGEERWSREVGWGGFWVDPTGDTHLRSQGALVRVDSSTGQQRWELPEMRGKPAFDADGSVFAATGEQLGRYAGDSGQPVWTLDESGFMDPVVQDKYVMAGRRKRDGVDEFVVLDKADGSVQSRLKGPFYFLPQFTDGGKIILGRPNPDRTLELQVVDPISGEVESSRTTPPPNPIGVEQPTLYGSKFVHCGVKGDAFSRDSVEMVIAHDANTGQRLWTTEVEGLKGVKALGEIEGKMLVSGRPVDEFGDVLVALDQQTGEELWRMDPKTHVVGVEPGPSGKALLLSEEDGYRMHALELESGAEIWQFNTGDRLYPRVDTEGVTVVDHEGNIFRLGWEPDAPYEGRPPRDPGKSRGASNFHTFKPILQTGDEERQALWVDVGRNGRVDVKRDYLLVQDADKDGILTRQELGQLPSWETLAALDVDGNGLVTEREWLEQGLFLWKDANDDGLMSARELAPPGTDQGHYAVFDLERQRIEYSASNRFNTGHFPELRPPTVDLTPPVPELPPDYSDGLGQNLRAILEQCNGEFRDRSGNRWIGREAEDGLKVFVEVPGFQNNTRYNLEFQAQERAGSLRLENLNSGVVRELAADAEGSSSESIFFPYPDHWEGDILTRGGGVGISFEGGPQLQFKSGDMFERLPDGRLNQIGMGGGSRWDYDQRVETEIPGGEPDTEPVDSGEITFGDDFIDVNGVLVPINT